MIYRKREGARLTVDATTAGMTLASIAESNDGELTAQAVVDASKAKRAPLHECFEWDDRKAGPLYRLEQAREIIRAVVVVDVQPDASDDGAEPAWQPVRAFVRATPGESEAYVSTVRALADPSMREEVLDRAMRELRGWSKRYRNLREFAAVVAAIDAVTV